MTPAYSWDHPHTGQAGSCPDEPFHASFITVQITDAGGNSVVRQYTLGSRAGRGQVPQGGGVFTPQPTTVVRTGAPTAASTSAPTASTGTASISYGINYPLAGLGTVLVAGGAGLWYAGRRKQPGGVAQQKADDPCARERENEAGARARLDAANERLDRIRSLETAADTTARDAATRDADAARAKDPGTVTSYVNNEGQTVYPDPRQRARIEAADAAARSARAAADAARSAFDAAGGATERGNAQTEQYRAERDWRDANDSLQRCLHLQAQMESLQAPAADSRPRVSTTAPGGAGTQTREGCGDRGAVRNDTSTALSPPLVMKDLDTAEIRVDGTRLVTDDTFARGFLDFLGGDAYKIGKIAVRVATGVRVGTPLDTYYSAMGGALDRGMNDLLDRLARYRRFGTYSLAYTERTFEVACRTWEECDGTTWVPHRELQVTLQSVQDRTYGGRDGDIANDDATRRDVIRHLFSDLMRDNARQQDRLSEFDAQCGAPGG
jgi:hypothetical protein